MSDAQENAEGAEPIEPAVTPDADADQQQDQGPSVEDRAMAMGWTPKGQFKGDPERWVDAETFVKRGEEFLPFLKANNARLEKALERANARIEQMDKGLKGAIQQLSTSEKRAYERARAELEAELEQYARAGDVESVKAVSKDIAALEKETAGKADDASGPEGSGVNPDFAAWRGDNDWYGKDKALSAAFDALCDEVAEEGYSTPKVGLKEAERRLREQFPAKFTKPENPNRKAPAFVESGGGGAARAGKTYADLPHDARKMCDDLCRDIKGFTREKYVKDYFAQEAKK